MADITCHFKSYTYDFNLESIWIDNLNPDSQEFESQVQQTLPAQSVLDIYTRNKISHISQFGFIWILIRLYE